ncbi:MAG: non-homologous end-joining DNA ligase [Solirubrobacteraceae bacterium]
MTEIEVDGRAIALSSQERVLFPETGLTKGDVVEYFARIAPRMLPYLQGRPLNLERYRKAVTEKGAGFLQQHASDHFPGWVSSVEVPKHGGTVRHVIADDAASLVYLANQGALTFHGWSSRLPDLDHPDRLVIDLDPATDDFRDVKRAARHVHKVLDDLGLEGFPMTSGSRGVHVIVPLDGSQGWKPVWDFGKRIQAAIVERDPQRLTGEFLKENRDERLYVDLGRTRYAHTAVMPYSVRGRPEAPVAAPLEWGELPRIDSARKFTLVNLFRRLGSRGADPWDGYEGARRPLPQA